VIRNHVQERLALSKGTGAANRISITPRFWLLDESDRCVPGQCNGVAHRVPRPDHNSDFLYTDGERLLDQERKDRLF
jgi:hypothetical protein